MKLALLLQKQCLKSLVQDPSASLKATETDASSSKKNTLRCQKSITSDAIRFNTEIVHQFLWTFVSKATVGYLSKKDKGLGWHGNHIVISLILWSQAPNTNAERKKKINISC